MKIKIIDALTYLILIVGGIVVIYPLAWMIIASFKSVDEFYTNPFGLPKRLILSNFVYVWKSAGLGRGFINSIIATTFTIAIVYVLSCMAAYAFARISFPLRSFLFYAFLLSMIMPVQVTILPLFLVLKRLTLIGRLPGLVVAFSSAGIAFSIYLLRSFFFSIPVELEEAAFLEGCSRYGVLLRIIVPLSRPALATLGIFQGMNVWNDFFTSLIIASEPTARTLPVRVYNFMTVYVTQWAYVFCSLTITVIPIIIIYLFFQTQFVSGLTAGSLKG